MARDGRRHRARHEHRATSSTCRPAMTAGSSATSPTSRCTSWAARTTPMTPEEYIAGLEGARRDEIAALDELIRATLPQLEPHVASGMLADGRYRYRYASGREGEWFHLGLASRKQYISLYVVAACDDGTYLAERYASAGPRRTSARAACASSALPTSTATSSGRCSPRPIRSSLAVRHRRDRRRRRGRRRRSGRAGGAGGAGPAWATARSACSPPSGSCGSSTPRPTRRRPRAGWDR